MEGNARANQDKLESWLGICPAIGVSFKKPKSLCVIICIAGGSRYVTETPHGGGGSLGGRNCSVWEEQSPNVPESKKREILRIEA